VEMAQSLLPVIGKWLNSVQAWQVAFQAWIKANYLGL
jgi:hypothetical protein